MIRKLLAFFCDRSLVIFLFIGVGNTLITMVGSQLLLGSLGYWGSTALMFTVTSIASFVLNRKYSFESKAPLLQSAVRFSIVIAVCYLISFSLSKWAVPLVVGAFEWPIPEEWVTRLAMLAAQVIFTGCNYIGQRLYAFKE